jgi:DNA-binding protein HU-beta
MAGKADIVDHVASNVEGITKKQAGDALDAVVEAIADNLKDGDRVSIPGLGSFSVADRAARTGRNPATGATIQIPASKAVKFKVAKDLKEDINS